MFRRQTPCLLLLVLLAPLGGCSKTTGRLTGSVTLNGEPLSTGVVVAYQDKEVLATATIVDGKYELINLPQGPVTLVVRTHGLDGTPLGIGPVPRAPSNLPERVRKEVAKGMPGPSRETLEKVKAVPLNYTHVSESGLEVTVGTLTTYNIEMTGKGEVPKPPKGL